MPARFLSRAEVAEELNVSTAQVYALLRRGDLRALQLGGRRTWRIGRDDLEDGRPFIASADIRTASRAFNAARQVAASLSIRRVPEPDAWTDLHRFAYGFRALPEVTTWQLGRDRLAVWLTDPLRDCGVRVVARWDTPRLHVTEEVDGLLGTLAVLLSREIGQGDRYICDVCGAPVDRVRAPRAGEKVYCDKPTCRREQQRRNQAQWRAKKRAEGGD